MDDTLKTRMTINIMGVDYQIITDDEPERVKQIAAFVDKLIRETKSSSVFMNNMSAAVLASLNLSEELYKLKDDVEDYREREREYQLLVNYRDELTNALKELGEVEEHTRILQKSIERLETENEELNDLLDEYKDKFNTLRTEYELNKRTLADMQNKLLENQIELVKARKSLLDFDD